MNVGELPPLPKLPEFISSNQFLKFGVLFVLGLALGYLLAKIVKYVIAILLILALISFIGLATYIPVVSELSRLIMSFLGAAAPLIPKIIEALRNLAAMTVGLIVGFILGLVK